jgi:hypothetical protein
MGARGSFPKLKKKKKNYGQYEKFLIQLVKLQKFGTLEDEMQKLKL